MATVIQRPVSLNLLRNLNHFKISSSAAVTFKLTMGNTTVLEETYNPDRLNVIDIDVQEVVAQYLAISLPSANVFSQSSGQATFSAYVNDSFDSSFTVVAGGVRHLSDTASNFLKANWLTWQPQTKQVRWNQPEHLTYYHETAGVVKAKFYPKTGNPEVVTVHSASAGELKSYNTEMAHLFSLSSHDPEELYGLVDVWVQTSGGTRLSWIQRYVFTPDTRNEHYYLCLNSLGGVDTFCFTGACSLAPSINHESAELSDTKVNITDGQERGWTQTTGYFGKTEAVWLWDFFAAAKHWAVIDGYLEEIILDSSSVRSSDRSNVNSSDFSYTLAEEGKLLKIVRSNEDFPLIEVPSPQGELFF